MSDAIDLSKLDIDELGELINKANRLRKSLIDAKRSELIKELEALDALGGAPVRSSEKRRASPEPDYVGPEGETWSGRGGVPKWGEKYGATDREGMQQFRKTKK